MPTFTHSKATVVYVNGVDLTTFHEVKGSTVAYLQEFLTNLEHRTHAIGTS